VVFDFAVVVSDFALISARLAWSCCGIRLYGSGIRLRPNLCTRGMVSLQYSTSRWWYPTSPESLYAWCGLVAVFDFAVAVSNFALICNRFLQVVVAVPGHRCSEIGLSREIIFDFDLSRFNATGFVRSSSLYRPRGVSIFPDR